MCLTFFFCVGVQVEAAKAGYSQILWLVGDKHELSEVGTMNLFVYWVNEHGEKELVTAPLDGTILPGVTRDSVLELAREWREFRVSERAINMAQVRRVALVHGAAQATPIPTQSAARQLIKALSEKRVLEIFGAGTGEHGRTSASGVVGER